MAHAMTQNDYRLIRDNRYTVITFKNGKRLLTYGNLPAHRAVEEVVNKTSTKAGIVCKMYPEGTAPKGCSWDLADY